MRMKIHNLIAILAMMPSLAFAAQIQKQGIVTPAICASRGVSNANCLPDDTQTFVTASGINQTLNYAIANNLIGGGSNPTVLTKTSNYTVLSSDGILLGNASGGAFQFTLPAASANSGKVYYFKKIDSSTNAVTIARAGSDTIEGATSVSMSSQYEGFFISSNGAANTWSIHSNYTPYPVGAAGDKEQIYRVIIDVSGTTPSITSQNGNWVSSVNRTGTGNYALNFTNSMPAGTTCVCTAFSADVLCAATSPGNPTTNTYSYSLSQGGSGTPQDFGAAVICMGPR